MIRIDYTITSGAFPVTVELTGEVILSNIHYSPESGYFDGVPEGDYEITFTDSENCVASEQLQWCDCPEGYSQTGSNCVKYEEVQATYYATTYTVVRHTNSHWYGSRGALFFSSWNYNGTGTYETFGDDNNYWVNKPFTPGSYDGALNRVGVWASTTLDNQDVGMSFCINIAVSKTYYIGFGCDNWGKIKINGNYVLEQDVSALATMLGIIPDPGNIVGHVYWYIYPIQLTAGSNVIELFGHNTVNVASVGFEIYDATPADIMAATSDADLLGKVLFRTTELVDEPLQYEYSTSGGYHGYSCPEGYALDTCGEIVRCVQKDVLECGETTSTSTSSTTTTTTTTVCNANPVTYTGANNSGVPSSTSGITYNIGTNVENTSGNISSFAINITKTGSPDFNVRCSLYTGLVTDGSGVNPFGTLVEISPTVISTTSHVSGTDMIFNFNCPFIAAGFHFVLTYENVVTNNDTNRIIIPVTISAGSSVNYTVIAFRNAPINTWQVFTSYRPHYTLTYTSI